jgi:hypothetical protein
MAPDHIVGQKWTAAQTKPETCKTQCQHTVNDVLLSAALEFPDCSTEWFDLDDAAATEDVYIACCSHFDMS